MRHAHDPPSTLTSEVRKDRWRPLSNRQRPLSLSQAMTHGANAMALSVRKDRWRPLSNRQRPLSLSHAMEHGANAMALSAYAMGLGPIQR